MNASLIITIMHDVTPISMPLMMMYVWSGNISNKSSGTGIRRASMSEARGIVADEKKMIT